MPKSPIELYLLLFRKTFSSPDFNKLYNEGSWMKVCMQLSNNISQDYFSRNPKKIYLLDRFSLFLNPYGLIHFSTPIRMRTGIFPSFEPFIIKLA